MYTGVKRTGYDTLSHALLYSVYVPSMSNSEPALVRRKMTAVTSATIVSIESIESRAEYKFGLHKWAATFSSTECLAETMRTRMLLITSASS